MFSFDGLNKAGSAESGREMKPGAGGAYAKTSRAWACLKLALAGLLFAVCAANSMATSITEYSLSPIIATPTTIVSGPDGRLWFAEFSGISGGYANDIGRITTNASLTTGTTVTNFPITTPVSSAFGITVGADNNLWFTEYDANKIGCMNTNGTMLGEFTLPTPTNHPMGIIRGPDNNLWFTERYTGRIGTITNYPTFIPGQFITNSSHLFVEIATSTNLSLPSNLANGPDGNIWFTENGIGVGRIARVNVQMVHNTLNLGQVPGSNTIVEFQLSNSNSQPFGITAGPDNALWFTEYATNVIGRIPVNATNSASIIEYVTPSINSAPYGITLGKDGNLWFAESGVGQIGRVVPNGTNTNAVFAEFVVPSGLVFPAFLAAGPDGNIWFTEFNGNSVGKVSDSPLTLTVNNYQFAAGTAFNNVVANFSDTDVSNALVSSFSAVIDWGDGSSSAGTITTNAAAFNYFNVTGAHTYTAPALYLAEVTVTDNDTSHDPGGATVAGTNTFTVTSTGGRPKLGIQQQAGTNVIIFWPGSDTGFQPQATTNLVSGSNQWLNLASTPVLVSSPTNPAAMFFEVTNRIAGKVFYRLKK